MSETEKQKTDYKNTLNLPQTAFPMKADLALREPPQVQKWNDEKLHQKVFEAKKSHQKFVLHDGPPYANGNIHFGHILNKLLKDFIVKYKNLSGYQSYYIPGWDCHGLPIEHQVDKDLGPKKNTMSVLERRKYCRDYAQKFVSIQRDEFKRLGILADWENPYLTLNYSYEANILRTLAKMIGRGSVYRGRKPVYWCSRCQTALAEAEVEYENHVSPSVYVKFKLSDPSALGEQFGSFNVYAVIWTTTPWTLAANNAIALNKAYTYVALKVGEEIYLVAEGLKEKFKSVMGFEVAEELAHFSAKKLEGLHAIHPFLDRFSKVVLSDHVSLEDGTGCVHIAPGHGQEDYEVGVKYGLDILNPVDHQGRYTAEVGVEEWVGLQVFEANPKVIEMLQAKNALLKHEDLSHSYPHCWRCKKPVIFRSTPQWFISMDKQDLRHKSLDAIRRSEWVPAWGRERIYGMIENRSDWCISRQRSWGVPITAFDCEACGEVLLDENISLHIADLFEKEGADAWFSREASELLPEQTQCKKCSGKSFKKQNDILDVWFDSGASFKDVLLENDKLSFPADIYLEGSDQHRGWFHSSLLLSIGTTDQAPYKTVLTHGFVVDGQGKKYSKSAKNYTPPDQILKKNGAEILRLWVAAEDYRNDIRVSDEILARLIETYRKIRNTFRFMLGSLEGFDPKSDLQDFESLQEIDQWALQAYAELAAKLKKAYESFEFHQIYHLLNQFMTVELSAFYLDILKDRLYTSAPKSQKRLAAQSVLYLLSKALCLWMSPILSFTAEEIWAYLPHSSNHKLGSIFEACLEEIPQVWRDRTLLEKYANLKRLREEVLKALEKERKNKKIGSSLEALVKIHAQGTWYELLKQNEPLLPTLFIVSQVVLVYEMETPSYSSENIEGLHIQVVAAEGNKCERCWNYSLTVGKHEAHPDVCQRCAGVLELVPFV